MTDFEPAFARGETIVRVRNPDADLQSGWDGGLTWADWFWADEITLTDADKTALEAAGWWLDEDDAGRDRWCGERGNTQGR